MPLVSVVIPTFNRASMIRDALASILAQSLKDLEIIVVDGRSADNTQEVVAEFASSLIQYHCNEKPNATAAQNRNRGIELASGKYIAFLDSDDLFMPPKLERQVQFLESHPEVGLVYTAYKSVDESLNCLAYHPASVSGWVFKTLLYSCQIATPSVMVPRQLFSELGGFDEAMDVAEDNDMWIRIAAQYPIGAINEPLCKVRIHGRGIPRDPELIVRDRLHCIEKNIAGRRDVSWIERRRLYANVYRHAFHAAASAQYRKRVRRTVLFARAFLYWPDFAFLRAVVKSRLEYTAAQLLSYPGLGRATRE
jgi:glycosyltransferase involved in cell wall biosynthesis